MEVENSFSAVKIISNLIGCLFIIFIPIFLRDPSSEDELWQEIIEPTSLLDHSGLRDELQMRILSYDSDVLLQDIGKLSPLSLQLCLGSVYLHVCVYVCEGGLFCSNSTMTKMKATGNTMMNGMLNPLHHDQFSCSIEHIRGGECPNALHKDITTVKIKCF